MQLPCSVTKCECFPQVRHMIYRVTGCGMNLQQNLELSVLRYGLSYAHFIDYTRHRMHNECRHSWACGMFSGGRCRYQGSGYIHRYHTYPITTFPIYTFISVITDWLYVLSSHAVCSRDWYDSDEVYLLLTASVTWGKDKTMQGVKKLYAGSIACKCVTKVTNRLY
jgi:hypothetical protein